MPDANDTGISSPLLSAVQRLAAAEAVVDRQADELLSLTDKLDEERLRYQLLFDRARAPYLTTDREGRILELNDAALAMFDCERTATLGTGLASFIARHDRRRFEQGMLEVDDSRRGLFRIVTPSRRRLDAEVHVFPNEQSQSWIFRDVTAEMEAESRIRDLSRQLSARVLEQVGELSAVYDQLPVGLAMVNRSRRAPPRLNRRGQELLGETFPFDELVRRALAGRDVRAAVIHSGERVFEASAAALQGPAEAITGAIVTFDDVTERTRIERAAQEFVSNAAHQLRSPIAAIGSTVAALRAGAAEDPSQRGRFLDHLEIESDRLARTVEAMLVLSRAERHAHDAPLTVVRLRPLVRRLVSDAKPAPGVRLSWDCAENLVVIAHSSLLEEALSNALSNATEHTRAGTISVTAAARENDTLIEVADTGPGMEPTVRDRAFERFFGSTPTRKGAGLGLAIAAAAVRASRGSIELESAPGEGTRLRIFLTSATLVDR